MALVLEALAEGQELPYRASAHDESAREERVRVARGGDEAVDGEELEAEDAVEGGPADVREWEQHEGADTGARVEVLAGQPRPKKGKPAATHRSRHATSVASKPSDAVPTSAVW